MRSHERLEGVVQTDVVNVVATTTRRSFAYPGRRILVGITSAKRTRMTTLTLDELEHVHGGVQPDMWNAMQKVWDLGLQVQGVHTGNHVANSNHWRGRAIDVGGSPAQMQKLVDWARGTNAREIIYKDQFYKNGQRIRGIGNHQDHVHLG